MRPLISEWLAGSPGRATWDGQLLEPLAFDGQFSRLAARKVAAVDGVLIVRAGGASGWEDVVDVRQRANREPIDIVRTAAIERIGDTHMIVAGCWNLEVDERFLRIAVAVVHQFAAFGVVDAEHRIKQ